MKDIHESSKIKWLVVINPRAGKGDSFEVWHRIKAQPLLSSFVFTVTQTAFKGHAKKLVPSAISQGYRNILCVGGDGTNHEVIDGIMRSSDRKGVHYALYPNGSGNDFARHHQISSHIPTWTNDFVHGKSVTLDVGYVSYNSGEKHYFANAAGLGLDACVVQRLQARPDIRNRYMYFVQALKSIWIFNPVKTQVRWQDQYDEKVMTADILSVQVGNGKYAGGGLKLVPHASTCDGLLSVTIVHKMRLWKVISNLFFLLSGQLNRSASVTIFHTSRLYIEPVGTEKMLVETDGECSGVAPCSFGIIKQAILLHLSKQSDL